LNKPFRRNKFISSDSIQLKIVSLLLVSILAPVLFIGSFLYFFIFRIFSTQPAVPGYLPNGLSSAIMKTNLAIMIGFIPLLLLLFVWGVIISNRITGPLRRLQGDLDEMIKSGAVTRLSIRKDDYLRPLITSINKLLVK
jgi:hypothetical protein